MCRLFLYISKNTRSIPPIYVENFINIAKEGLSKKCGLSPHGDGFGVFWLSDDSYGLYKSLKPIWMDKIILPDAKLYLFHARKAGIGNITFLNTHPFIKKGIVLVHNGNIYGFNRNPARYLVYGNTDSEKFLALMQNYLEYYDDLERAFLEAINSVDLATSLNMIIVSILERKVIGSNIYFRSREKCPSYYTMWMKLTDSELLIASEPFDTDWSPLSKEKGTLTIFTVPIDDITKLKVITLRRKYRIS